jgi:hypothetical protein
MLRARQARVLFHVTSGMIGFRNWSPVRRGVRQCRSVDQVRIVVEWPEMAYRKLPGAASPLGSLGDCSATPKAAGLPPRPCLQHAGYSTPGPHNPQTESELCSKNREWVVGEGP